MTASDAGERLATTQGLPPETRRELLDIVERLNRAIDDLERLAAEEEANSGPGAQRES
jgi:hypothetical protein